MRSLLLLGLFIFVVSPVFPIVSISFKGSGSTPQPSVTSISGGAVSLLKVGATTSYAPGEYDFSLPHPTQVTAAGLYSDGSNAGFVVRGLNTDSANGWMMMISSTQLVHSDGVTTIPFGTAYQWFVPYVGVWDESGANTANGAPGWIDTASSPSNLLASSNKLKSNITNSTGFIPFSGGAQTIYQSGSSSFDRNHSLISNVDGTEVSILLGIVIPSAQRVGTYTGTLSFMITTQ